MVPCNFLPLFPVYLYQLQELAIISTPLSVSVRGLRFCNPSHEERPSEYPAGRQRVPSHPGQGCVRGHHGMWPGCEVLQRKGWGKTSSRWGRCVSSVTTWLYIFTEPTCSCTQWDVRIKCERQLCILRDVNKNIQSCKKMVKGRLDQVDMNRPVRWILPSDAVCSQKSRGFAVYHYIITTTSLSTHLTPAIFEKRFQTLLYDARPCMSPSGVGSYPAMETGQLGWVCGAEWQRGTVHLMDYAVLLTS